MSLALAVFVAVVVVGVVVAFMASRRANSHIQQLAEKRRATSKVVGRGAYVESGSRIDVALALTDSTFFYENDALQASLDLSRVDEVEYDDELSTGSSISDGKVMRLRSHSRTFEFVVPSSDVQRWESALPPHQVSDELRR